MNESFRDTVSPKFFEHCAAALEQALSLNDRGFPRARHKIIHQHLVLVLGCWQTGEIKFITGGNENKRLEEMDTTDIEIRRAHLNEFGQIANLISSFALDVVPADEREHGFVQGLFTERMVAWFSNSLCVLIAADRGRVVAALCACRLDERDLPPELNSLRRCLDQWQIGGRTIDHKRSFGYGPVCIDRRYQGKGLLRQLFQHLCQTAAPAFDTGVAFVDPGNRRSLRAHRDGLGMVVLGYYESGNSTRIALGFDVSGMSTRKENSTERC